MIEVTGAQLHAARVLAGLSRQELADRAYVSRDTIGCWERSSHAAVIGKPALLNRTIEALQVADVTFTPGGVDRVRPSECKSNRYFEKLNDRVILHQ